MRWHKGVSDKLIYKGNSCSIIEWNPSARPFYPEDYGLDRGGHQWFIGKDFVANMRYAIILFI